MTMEVSHLRASRRAHRAHLTRIFGKIDAILESNDAPDERNTATLQTSLEQLEAKKCTIAELDTKIVATIEDPEALESEILDSEEIMFNVAEKITLVKAVLARPKPLNIQALPFQPQSVMIPPSSNSISDQLSSHSVSDRPSNHTVSDQPSNHTISDQPSSHTVSDQSASHSAIVQPSNEDASVTDTPQQQQ